MKNVKRHRKINSWVPASILTLLLTGPAFAADWYVDGSAGSGGSGTQSAPFQNIQKGIDQVQPGDTLIIRAGTYSENLTTSTHGTATEPIVVMANPGDLVTVTGTTGERLQLAGNYWIFEGFTVDQNNILDDAVEVNGHHITFRQMEIRNGRREGISIEKAYSIIVEDSSIHDFIWIDGSTRRDAHCIMIDTDRSGEIHDIYIHRNTIARCSGDGLQIFGETGQDPSTFAKNIEIIDNTFTDGTTDTQLGLTENALDFKAGDTVLVKGNTMSGYKNNKTIVVQKACRNFTFENNILLNGDRGIEMRQEGGENFIQENLTVIGNIFEGMQGYALKFDGVRNISVLHNTIVNVQGNSIFFESSLGSGVPSAENGIIKNNLMYQSGSGRIKDPISNIDIEYNGWFQSTPDDLGDPTDTLGSDPQFVNPGINQFDLLANSPAIDKGIPMGMPFAGVAPDLGAKEHSSEIDTTPPAPPTGLKIMAVN
jgi:hypothetical protein